MFTFGSGSIEIQLADQKFVLISQTVGLSAMNDYLYLYLACCVCFWSGAHQQIFPLACARAGVLCVLSHLQLLGPSDVVAAPRISDYANKNLATSSQRAEMSQQQVRAIFFTRDAAFLKVAPTGREQWSGGGRGEWRGATGAAEKSPPAPRPRFRNAEQQ